MRTLWALTSYFNPCGWRSRRRNFATFRRRLGVPLVAVEWHPEGRFELRPGDADVLVQVRGGDLMWQKERLLNVARAHLPAEATDVAWLDAGIVFPDPDWATRTLDALARADVVQPFSRVRFLDPAQTAALATGTPPADRLAGAPETVSTARLAADVGPDAVADADLRGHATPALAGDGNQLPRSPGIAWAARRAVIDDLGFFDRAVIGSGDLLFSMAVLGVGPRWFDGAARLGFGYLAGSGYAAWARRAAERVGGRVGYVEGEVLHLHHGRLADRGYKSRHRAFDALGLDVGRDLRLDAGGAWALVDAKPAWTRFFDDYFRGRDEDRGWVG